MSYLDNLRPASWRGVPFKVVTSEYTFGRRVAVHEFVNQDLPQLEDMGRATRTKTIEAYIPGTSENGFNPWPQRDSLIAACETPGVGTLVHPMFGTLTGVMRSCRGSEATTRGAGIVRLTLEFIEGGDAEYSIKPIDDTARSVTTRVELARQAVIDDMAAGLIIDGQEAKVIDTLSAQFREITAKVSGARRTITLATQIAQGNLSGIEYVRDTLAAVSNLSLILSTVDTIDDFTNYTLPVQASPRSTVGAALASNSSVMQTGIRSLAAIRSAEMAAEFKASQRYDVPSVALRGVPAQVTKKEATAYRKNTYALLSDVAEQAFAVDMEKTGLALGDLRATVVSHITAKSEGLAGTMYTTCCNRMATETWGQSVVVAYEVDGELTDDALNARNDIRNPLFIPPRAKVEIVQP